MRRTFALAALFALAAVSPAAAQPRPELPRDADPNDWESYFAVGERLFVSFPRGAGEAFEWAARLDPTRAEPLLARWAAFYARDESLWVSYLNDEERTLRRPDVIRNEENLRMAYVRNPFVHRGLEAALLANLGRRLRWDRATEAFVDYGRGDFRKAARDFGRLVRNNPERNMRLRHYRALALIGDGQTDSAAVEIETLLTALRERDEQEVGDGYQSKAMWEHALGLVYETRGDTARARQAYERSVVEDLTWYPARMGLARLELRAGNAAAAVEHLAQAVEIAPDDGVLRLEYANALTGARNGADAVTQLQLAMEMEPYWAEPYLRLARVYDALGQAEQAVEMYRGYLERAPRRQSQAIETVNRRLAQLAPG
jgi:tetratricopeptide (TPR) repeat protein